MQSLKDIDLDAKIPAFVNELDGRYHEWISDQMLIVSLKEYFIRRFRATKNPLPSNIAYAIGCDIFETILEYGCKAGGNGHHVAQALADKFK